METCNACSDKFCQQEGTSIRIHQDEITFFAPMKTIIQCKREVRERMEAKIEELENKLE